MTVTVTDMTLPEVEGGSAGLTGVLAVPEGIGPWPGVVLVHEAYGVTDVMRRQVVRMAEAGYLALMPDLFSQGGARRCLVATFRALRSGEGRAFVDIESARALLAARSDSTGVTGVLGFCMGGGFALVASTKGFGASAPFYPPPLQSKYADIVDGACPIVASFGQRDRLNRGSGKRLEEVLTEKNIPHDVKTYPHAGHSFADRAPLQALSRITGFGENKEAAADAWQRVFAFFGHHLG